MFNINDFSYKNRNEMVNRIREKRLLEESASWNIENFKTNEEIDAEISRLEADKQKHIDNDDMPSFYFENIDNHLKQLYEKKNNIKENLNESFLLLGAATAGIAIPIIGGVLGGLLTGRSDKNQMLTDLINDSVPNKKSYYHINNILHIIKKYNKKEYNESLRIKEDLYKEIKIKYRIIKNVTTIFITPQIQKEINRLGEIFQKALKNKENANQLSESRLPSDPNVDPQFGVPSQKKYPLFDEKHVRSAIKLFGHVDAEYEQQLARAIMAKMKKYGISYDEVGPDNKLYKWIPESYRMKK